MKKAADSSEQTTMYVNYDAVKRAYLLHYLKSPYAVAKIERVRKTITVSTFADSRALAFVNNRTMNATAFQKKALACEPKH
jgi:hypothetical protein